MAQVRYFAAAADAAGCESELRHEETLGALTDAICASAPALAAILPRCAVLVDGRRSAPGTPLGSETTVDILPPFAGG